MYQSKKSELDSAKILDQSRSASLEVYDELGTQFGVAKIPVHTHNGRDSNRIPFKNISGSQMTLTAWLPGTSAATAGNYGVFWIAPFPCAVISCWESHETAGTAVGTVTVTLEKLLTGVAPASGIELLTTALSLKSTINTPQQGAIVASSSGGVKNSTLAIGDRLAIKDAGTLTSVAGVTVTVVIQLP